MRVDGAVDFAMQLASEHGVLPDFQEGLAKGDESFVKLNREIPVRLLYRTAYYDGSMVRLVPDIYGWDDPIAARLGFGAVPPRRRPPGGWAWTSGRSEPGAQGPVRRRAWSRASRPLCAPFDCESPAHL